MTLPEVVTGVVYRRKEVRLLCPYGFNPTANEGWRSESGRVCFPRHQVRPTTVRGFWLLLTENQGEKAEVELEIGRLKFLGSRDTDDHWFGSTWKIPLSAVLSPKGARLGSGHKVYPSTLRLFLEELGPHVPLETRLPKYCAFSEEETWARFLSGNDWGQFPVEAIAEEAERGKEAFAKRLQEFRPTAEFRHLFGRAAEKVVSEAIGITISGVYAGMDCDSATRVYPL